MTITFKREFAADKAIIGVRGLQKFVVFHQIKVGTESMIIFASEKVQNDSDCGPALGNYFSLLELATAPGNLTLDGPS
jgi:hypothetical protein